MEIVPDNITLFHGMTLLYQTLENLILYNGSLGEPIHGELW